MAKRQLQYGKSSEDECPMRIPKLFAALKKKRDFERKHLPFISSLVDYDIIIEIGYVQEQDRALTVKQLFLLKIASDATVRRRLARLTARGSVRRTTNVNDHRSDCLALSVSSLKAFDKYGALLAGIVTPS
jgi:DNA-binding MarR family transcriptional regulator